MLTYEDALNMEYYKKTSYTGWMEGMRFKIAKEEPEDSDKIFHAWVWPGPYIFDKTPDNKKSDSTFPFTDEGRKAAVDWINEQFVKENWAKKMEDV